MNEQSATLDVGGGSEAYGSTVPARGNVRIDIGYRARARYRRMTLDVGCGDNQKGDVNIDIQKPLGYVENFVLADAEHLPFKTKCFNSGLRLCLLEK